MCELQGSGNILNCTNKEEIASPGRENVAEKYHISIPIYSILFYANLRLLVRVRRLQRRMGSSSSMLDHEDSMSAVLDILTKSSPPSKKLLLF